MDMCLYTGQYTCTYALVQEVKNNNPAAKVHPVHIFLFQIYFPGKETNVSRKIIDSRTGAWNIQYISGVPFSDRE